MFGKAFSFKMRTDIDRYNDIWIEILMYLPAIERQSISRVSPYFRMLIKTSSLWKTLEICGISSRAVIFLKNTLQLSKNVTDLTINVFEDEPNVESRHGFLAILTQWLSLNTCIHTLKLIDNGYLIYRGTFFFECFKFIPNLRHLIIAETDGLDGNSMKLIVNSCPLVESFTDLTIFGLSLNCLKYATRWQSIKKLSLNTEYKSVEDICFLLGHILGLQFLSLRSFNEEIKSESIVLLNAILIKMKNLKEFHLNLDETSHLDGLNAIQWEQLLQSTTVTTVAYTCSLEAYFDTDLKVFPVRILVWNEKCEYEFESGFLELKQKLIPIKDYFKKFFKWNIICSL